MFQCTRRVHKYLKRVGRPSAYRLRWPLHVKVSCCCCCCCLSLVEGLSSSRVSPTDSLTLQSSMHFYMHVTPLHRGFEPTMPFHTAYPHVLLCGLAWHLGAVVRLSRDNLSYFSVHCTPFYIADFQSAR